MARTIHADGKNDVQTAVGALPITKPPLVSEQVTKYMKAEKIDAWISFQYSDKLKNDAMSKTFHVPKGLTNATTSVFFADGREPLLFVARIEAPKFEHFKEYGTVIPCTDADEFMKLFAEKVTGCKKIAMEYGENMLSASALVPARVKESVQKATNAEIVPSMGVIQHAVVPLSPPAFREHEDAVAKLDRIMEGCMKLIRDGVENGKPVTEYGLREFISKKYKEFGMVSSHIQHVVAVNEHIANIHYEAPEKGSAEIRKGDVVLIDIWAKNDKEDAAYADITWMCFVGKEKDIPKKYADAFKVQVEASHMAMDHIKKAFKEGKPIIPCEVDAVARNHILKNGYPDYPHSTGHNLGTGSAQGEGVMISKKLTFPLVPYSCYTIEPGIYVTEIENGTENFLYGARTEFNFYLQPIAGPTITSRVQKEMVCLY